MALLQLLIIRNYNLRVIGFLHVNCTTVTRETLQRPATSTLALSAICVVY